MQTTRLTILANHSSESYTVAATCVLVSDTGAGSMLLTDTVGIPLDGLEFDTADDCPLELFFGVSERVDV